MDYTVLCASPDFSVPFMIYQSNLFYKFSGFQNFVMIELDSVPVIQGFIVYHHLWRYKITPYY
jgi:hypothetical protein